MVNDELAVGELATAARNVALRELAPRRNEMLATATTLGFALTATVRMVDRIHGHATNRRTNAEPALASGLAQRLLIVIAVADFPDRRAAFAVQHAELTRRHLQCR